MATNHYFSNYDNKGEQRLIEDIIVESIKIMGFDSYYLPNDNDAARDLLFGEDPVKKFQTAFPLEMYLSNATEYMGEKEFFSKFGLEIKNNVNVIVSKRSFAERVPQNTFTRPREGDLVYVPFLNGTGELYEIKFTNQTKDMFMLGRKVPYFYELELEKFKYSQEVITTGIPDIDAVVTDSAYTLNLNLSSGGTGVYQSGEIVFQSPDNTLANATSHGTVQTWYVPALLLTVTNNYGEFTDGLTIIGSTSNAHFTLATFDPLQSPAAKENYDNKYISNSANLIINTAENNPFGSI
jgi:hypothetical protein